MQADHFTKNAGYLWLLDARIALKTQRPFVPVNNRKEEMCLQLGCGITDMVGLVAMGCQVGLILGIFFANWSDLTLFSNGNIIFVVPKEFYDPQVSDGVRVTSNKSMDFSDH